MVTVEFFDTEFMPGDPRGKKLIVKMCAGNVQSNRLRACEGLYTGDQHFRMRRVPFTVRRLEAPADCYADTIIWRCVGGTSPQIE